MFLTLRQKIIDNFFIELFIIQYFIYLKTQSIYVFNSIKYFLLALYIFNHKFSD